jgi:hypothetical protein
MKVTGLNKPSIYRLGKNSFMNILTAEKLAVSGILLLLSSACLASNIPLLRESYNMSLFSVSPVGGKSQKTVLSVYPVGGKLQYVNFGVSPVGEKSQKTVLSVSPNGGKLQHVNFSISPGGERSKANRYNTMKSNI